MKSETKKPKKKKSDNFAIYNFPYFKKDRSFFLIFAGKALLAFITCFCGTFYFAQMLNAEESALVCSLFAGLSCLVFLVLLGLFGRLSVTLFVLTALMVAAKSLKEWGESFFYHILDVADGRIINAERLFGDRPSDAEPDAMPMLLILSVLFGFIFALSSHQRFNPEAILTYFAIMVIPSFLAQHTCYTSALGVFAAGVAGLWTVSLASSANASLAVGGMANTSVLDRQYRKNNRRQSPAKRIKSDAMHYNRYFSDSVVMFVTVLLTISIASSFFPEEGNLKLDGIVKNISQCVRSIGEWGSEFFEGINASPFKGFFSADGGSINISNGINPDDTPQGNTPVLEVTTQNKDKLFLRGDVGYEFDGRRWKSIADMDYGSIGYNVSARDEDMNIIRRQGNISEAFESYVPEIGYYLAYANMPGGDSESFCIEMQKVKINYLQRLNTVIFAGTPTNYTFRRNDLFSVRGDFVALADKGKINSMETSVLYQKGDVADMLSYGYGSEASGYGSDGYYGGLGYDGDGFAGLPVYSYDDYLLYSKAYREYVYDNYTAVPDSERRTLVNFLAYNTLDFEELTEAGDDMLQRAALARSMEQYFTSGVYRYSLAADNFTGEESPVYTFLFDTKAGHCAMYASSMCLLLRYMGVPARYVTGFTVGGDNCVETADGYKYTVLQKNLHAWVEVYYDDIGWIPYDPTPSGGRPAVGTAELTTPPLPETSHTTAERTTPSDSTTTSETTVTETSVPSVNESGEGTASGQKGDPTVFKIILTAVGAVLLLFIIVMSVRGALRSLDRKQSRLMKFFKNGEAASAVKEMLDFSLKLLAVKGIYRKKGETPEEFGFRADKALKAGNIFRGAVPLYERAEFDKDPEFTEEERLLVYESASRLLKYILDGMKPFKKLVTRIRLFGKRKTNSKGNGNG